MSDSLRTGKVLQRDMPRITVLYFATLREQKGCGEEELDVAADLTLQELYLTLFPPGPRGYLPVAFARNAVYASGSEPIQDGDEVAFIPPVGGG